MTSERKDTMAEDKKENQEEAKQAEEKQAVERQEAKKRFSIIIPVRNLSGKLPRLLSSIAKQTYDLDNVEVIVVDDASTDATPFVAERFGQDFPHFKLLRHKVRKCAGGARNTGCRVATGDYIFYNDADDMLPPKSLEQIDNALQAAMDPDVCIYPFWIESLDKSKSKLVKMPFKTLQEAVKIGTGAWTRVFKRSLAVPFPENILTEDVAWHFHQYDQFNTMTYVDSNEPCYYYDRTAEEAITNTNEWASQKGRFLEQLAFENFAIKEGKNDKWISDVLRNTAEMYVIRHKLRKPWVVEAWKFRCQREASNLRNGIYTL